MSTLYQLTGQYAEVVRLMDDVESYEQLQDTLESLEGEMTDKFESVIKMMVNLVGEAAMIKEEAKVLAERAKKKEAQAASLKRWLDDAMKRADLKKIETSIRTLSYRKNPASIEVVDYEKIPEGFLKEPKPREVDKTAILKELKDRFNGKLPDEYEFENIGVKLINNKESLQVSK